MTQTGRRLDFTRWPSGRRSSVLSRESCVSRFLRCTAPSGRRASKSEKTAKRNQGKVCREILAVLLMGMDLREKYLDTCVEIFAWSEAVPHFPVTLLVRTLLL